MSRLLSIAVAVGCIALSGCFGGEGVSCEDPQRYADSQSVPVVRVPEGLSLPDESQSLQIPPGEALEPPDPEQPNPCLEVPPDFFDEEEED